MAAMTASRYVGAIMATVQRDARIYFSYRFRWVSQILGVFLTLTMFFYIAKLVRPGVVGPTGAYYAYLVIGILLMGVLTAALTTSTNVRVELMQGNFERIMVSPLGPIPGIISIAAFPILYSVLTSATLLTVATLVFGVPLRLAGVVPALAVTLLATLAFMAVGLFFVALLIAFKSAAGTTWAIAGFSLVSGAYFPTRLFPGWLRWLSEVQPLTPTLELVRHLLVSTPTNEPVWIELCKVLGFTAVLLPLAGLLLSLSIILSRRRGTLLEF